MEMELAIVGADLLHGADLEVIEVIWGALNWRKHSTDVGLICVATKVTFNFNHLVAFLDLPLFLIL